MPTGFTITPDTKIDPNSELAKYVTLLVVLLPGLLLLLPLENDEPGLWSEPKLWSETEPEPRFY